MSADRELSRLLEHPAIWRGRSAARAETLPTGFAAFDARLPGKGWPRTGLIEILVSRFGIGELDLLLPALAFLTHRPSARWCAWVAPPLEPFAPALAARGVALEHMLVVRAPSPLWAFEQTLGLGACDVAMAWIERPHPREIRRLQLAAERGRALGILFRSQRAARESSPAVLRIALEPATQGVRITLLKSRGGARGSIDLALQDTAGLTTDES
jgi:hypothetical protein